MTSIPASRSARAMIFAPRSCPSRPGLATTTRIFFSEAVLAIGGPRVYRSHSGADGRWPPTRLGIPTASELTDDDRHRHALVQRAVEVVGAAAGERMAERAPDLGPRAELRRPALD